MRHEQGTSQGDGRAAKANTYIGICAGEDYQDPEEISGVDFRPSRARRSRFSGRYDFKILKGKSPKSPPATRRDNAARAGVSATGPSRVRTLRGRGCVMCRGILVHVAMFMLPAQAPPKRKNFRNGGASVPGLRPHTFRHPKKRAAAASILKLSACCAQAGEDTIVPFSTTTTRTTQLAWSATSLASAPTSYAAQVAWVSRPQPNGLIPSSPFRKFFSS